jgi:stress response protein YsnF
MPRSVTALYNSHAEAEAGEDAPREIGEQTFIFRETAEQLVVEKEIVVREEIVMRRTAEEHVEVVHDTVRRTEVEVERFGPDGVRPN